MTDLKTDQALLDRLEQAVKHERTADEIRRDKISFIMSTLDENSTITRSQVEARLQVMEGAA